MRHYQYVKICEAKDYLAQFLFDGWDYYSYSNDPVMDCVLGAIKNAPRGLHKYVEHVLCCGLFCNYQAQFMMPSTRLCCQGNRLKKGVFIQEIGSLEDDMYRYTYKLNRKERRYVISSEMIE